MAHFEQFFSEPHSPYVKYGSFAVLKRIAKLHTCKNSLKQEA